MKRGAVFIHATAVTPVGDFPAETIRPKRSDRNVRHFDKRLSAACRPRKRTVHESHVGSPPHRPGYGPNGRRTAPDADEPRSLTKPSDRSRIVRHPVYEPQQVLAKTVLLAQRQFLLQTTALAVDGLGTDVQNLRDLRGRQTDDNHAAKTNVVDRQLWINLRKAHRQIVVNLIDDPSQLGPAIRS